MLRAAVLACLPWLALLVAAIGCLWAVVLLGRGRLDLRRLRLLHRDQVGSLQSLSFVMTLPMFIILMMFIVQVSQIMIGTVVVQYAAFAATRSAVVWLPVAIAQSGAIDQDQEENEIPISDYGSRDGFLIRRIDSGSRPFKFKQVQYAAALACMPIAPSRDYGGGAGSDLADSVTRVYQAVSPQSTNERIPVRLANKLAYSLKNTLIRIEVATPREEWELDEDTGVPLIFLNNQIGWRDQVSVTVTHHYALLPGPGRMLARSSRTGGSDSVSSRISQQGPVYTYPLTATATLPNEGEKSVWVHPQQPLAELP